jgi:predicted porin
LESAKAGTVRLGNINNEILSALTGVGAPSFSTGVGSSYSSSWSVLNGYGTGASDKQNQVTATTNDNESAGARGIRQANTVKYVSPKFSDVTFAYGQALKNDQASGEANTVGVTDMSLTYANGPLTVMYASLKYNVGANDATSNGALTAGTTNTHTAFAASYALNTALKFHAAVGSSKSSNGTIADSTFNQYGVTYTMGAFDIMAQTAKVDDKLTANIDRKMTGLGVNYNLSKRTRVYARYDSLDRDTAHAHDNTKNTELKRTAVGISHSF